MSNNTKRKWARCTSMTLTIVVLYWLRLHLQLSLWETAVVWVAFVAVYGLSAYEHKEPDADNS